MVVFHPIGPVRLVHGQTSPVLALSLSPGDLEATIRVVVIFRDGEPLGGEAPTFQIAAGVGGLFTSVEAGSSKIRILTRDGAQAALAECKREPGDIFLITLTKVRENSDPWRMRIRNNDPEELDFRGFCSDIARDTLQPWMEIGNASGARFPSFIGKQSQTVEVRNFGTAALIFEEPIGPIGHADSSLALKGRPDRLEPHQAGFLTFATLDNPRRAGRDEFVIKSNDNIGEHEKMMLQITPASTGLGHPIEPPPSEFFCRTGCGCMEFKGPPTAGMCEFCGHSRVRHMPI